MTEILLQFLDFYNNFYKENPLFCRMWQADPVLEIKAFFHWLPSIVDILCRYCLKNRTNTNITLFGLFIVS